MPREMIRMSMGDKCPRTGALWIEPEIDLRQVEAALVTYFDQIGADPRGNADKRKAGNGRDDLCPCLSGKASLVAAVYDRRCKRSRRS